MSPPAAMFRFCCRSMPASTAMLPADDDRSAVKVTFCEACSRMSPDVVLIPVMFASASVNVIEPLTASTKTRPSPPVMTSRLMLTDSAATRLTLPVSPITSEFNVTLLPVPRASRRISPVPLAAIPRALEAPPLTVMSPFKVTILIGPLLVVVRSSRIAVLRN